MQVDQAIFTSVQSGRIQGYQLAAWSDGVDDRLAQVLQRWGPSHAALCDANPSAESFNFHPVEPDRYALSRTIYGGPEYSARGGLQLITYYALVETRQLRDFSYDPVALLRLARSEGLFGLLTKFESRLPMLTLPDATASIQWAEPVPQRIAETTEDLFRRIERGERVVVDHCFNPLTLVQHLIRRLPESRRLELSFTTGLKPTALRPFQLHFLAGKRLLGS